MSAIREELRSVGLARANHRKSDQALQERVRDVLRRSEGAVPVAEAARLLRIDRSTVYRLLERER